MLAKLTSSSGGNGDDDGHDGGDRSGDIPWATNGHGPKLPTPNINRTSWLRSLRDTQGAGQYS